MDNKGNLFKILGLYGKEVVISNMLSWLLNPKEDHNFGLQFTNDFLQNIGCSRVGANNDITIHREYYGKKNKKNNFIDIVIVEKNKDKQVVRVICIENKVFSSEGDKQTERYWNIIQDDFGIYNCEIECIYLTKNNFPVILSNDNFRHYKYSDLDAVFEKYSNNKIVHDFYEAYILQDRNKLCTLEALTFDSYPNHFKSGCMEKDLCFYVTEKFINSSNDIFCDIGNSAKGGGVFFRTWKQGWNKIIDDQPFNIHIEGYADKVYLHFETLPYTPYKKLDNPTKEIIDKQKEIYIEKISNLHPMEGVEKRPIRSNATLMIGNFKIKYGSFEEYYSIINSLVSSLDPIVSNS